MNIRDKLALLMIAYVDGSEWLVHNLKRDLERVESGKELSDCSFEYALRLVKSLREETMETVDGRSSTYLTDPSGQKAYDSTDICTVIYGSGGWNRFGVRADGTVLLSTFHCSPSSEAPHRAKQIGMGTY